MDFGKIMKKFVYSNHIVAEKREAGRGDVELSKSVLFDMCIWIRLEETG